MEIPDAPKLDVAEIDPADPEALDKLIKLQVARVAKDREIEEKMPKSVGSLSKEIEMLASLLEKRSRLAQGFTEPLWSDYIHRE